MLERFTPQDRRFVLLCLAALVGFGAVGVAYFHRAFPEAAIELKVNRGEARKLAAAFLTSVAGAPDSIFETTSARGWRFASRFSVDDEPKVYLERTLGLARANRLYGREARIWRWDLRWFRSAQKEEWKASFSTLGEPLGFEHVLPESAAGPRLDQAAAERKVFELLGGLGLSPDSLRLVEATSRTLPARTDWTIVMEKRGLAMGQATVRFRVVIAGDVPGSYREFVKVPEEWQRGYASLRSVNEATGQADSVLLLVTLLAMIGVLVLKTVRRDVPWRTVTAFGLVCFVLAFLAQANALPLSVFEYDTASPFPAFLTRQWVLVVMGALAQGLFLAIIVGAAEPIFRARFPQQVSVRGTFSARGLRTKACFKGIVLGYAMMAFFLAYQVVFYIVAEKLGAWAPAEVPYSNLLNTAFPWATVLLIGFLPAVSEEFMSRVFSISFLDRFIRSRTVVLVIPALIWGFGHAAYPNQPFYIRGLEVGLAGILVGVIFLRFGIVPVLVWHFTVDAGYAALLMFRSGNLYYIVSGAIAAGILVVPLILSLASYARRGGFEPTAGLCNGDEGVAPAPAEGLGPASSVATVRPLPARRLIVTAGIAGASLIAYFVPTRPVGDDTFDAIGPDRALHAARDFLEARGERSDLYRHVLYTGTGFAEVGKSEELRPEETGRLAGFSDDAAAYVLRHGGPAAYRRLSERKLPVGLWVVRFFRPGEKAEWKIAVDSRSGRVVQFVNAVEEAAPAGDPPTPAAARELLVREAASLGYPAAEYAVIDTGVQARPNRVDTKITLEAPTGGVGDARARLTGVFQGERLAAMWPAIKLPEEYLRQRQSRGTLYWVAVVARVLAGGTLLAVGLIVGIGVVRSGALRPRRLVGPMLVWVLASTLATLNALPSFWRIYPTEISLQTFQATMVVGLIVRILFLGVSGLIIFAYLEGAHPGWREALRRGGTWSDAVARSAVAATGFAGLHQVGRILADRLPAWFEVNASLPASLDFVSPGFQAFFSGSLAFLWIVGGVATASLALRDPGFSSRRHRWIAVALALILIAPLDARTAGEALGPYLTSVLRLAWMVVAGWLLLREHAAAWALFGLFTLVAGAALPLLQQQVGADRAQGVLALGLGILVTLALTVGPRPWASRSGADQAIAR